MRLIRMLLLRARVYPFKIVFYHISTGLIQESIKVLVNCILSFNKTLMKHIFVIKINYVPLQKIFLKTFVNAVNLKKYAILLVNRSCIFLSL